MTARLLLLGGMGMTLSEPTPTDSATGAPSGPRRRVTAGMVVTADGTVTDVRVIRRLGARLGERAVAAAQQWQFSPALRHGTPVAALVEVAVEFRLR